MSQLNAGAAQPGKFKTFIRQSVSPRVTGLYGRLGYANRDMVTGHINSLLRGLDHNSSLRAVDLLVRNGILKDNFSEEINSSEHPTVGSFMLKRTLGRDRIDLACEALYNSGIEGAKLFAENTATLARLEHGTIAGLDTITHCIGSNQTLAAAFSIGARTARNVGFTLGAAGALWFFGVPSLTIGNSVALGLAGTTALCAIAARINDRLPAHGAYGAAGRAARFLSRRVAPFIYAADGLALGGLAYANNLRLAGILDTIGLEGTTAFLFGLNYLVNRFVRKNTAELDRAYGGQLDPGKKEAMGKLMSAAAYSTAGEVHYMGARLLLLGSAAAFTLLNVYAAIGTVGLLPFAMPLLGVGATVALRRRKDVAIPGADVRQSGLDRLKFWKSGVYTDKEQAEKLDHAEVYAPLYGLGAGLGLAVIESAATLSPLPFIAYATLYGSAATFFVNELHGSFHSINTNLGFIAALKASARELIGDRDKKVVEGARVLAINPHTGLKEHTYGLLFSVLLNRKPGVSFICMFDLVPGEAKPVNIDALKKKLALPEPAFQSVLASLFNKHDGKSPTVNFNQRELEPALLELVDAGTISEKQALDIKMMILANQANHLEEKKYIAEVERLQKELFSIVSRGLAGTRTSATTLEERYEQLAKNLEAFADHCQGPLVGELNELIGKNGAWFETPVNLAEYRRAAFEQLTLRAEEARADARVVRRKLELYRQEEAEAAGRREEVRTAYAAELDAEIGRQLGCYDPDQVLMPPVMRKKVAGDERLVRKVENVSSGAIMRGMTVYKGWFKETSADRVFVEDWIPGTFTRVPNPRFRYDAESGTMEAAKYLWIEADNVMADLQQKNRKYLSTSRWIESFDNTPDQAEGFTRTTGLAEITVNGRTFTVDNAYFVKDGAQTAVPSVKAPNYRPGAAERDLPAGYIYPGRARLAAKQDEEIKPYVFTPPAYDFVIMMDKNDIQLYTTTLLPAILERSRRDIYLRLIMRYPVAGGVEFDNPFPDKKIDPAKGFEMIDTFTELSFTGQDGIERAVPYVLDRAAARAGVNETVNWQKLTGARVSLEGGRPTAFSLVYDKTTVMPLPPRDWPSYLGSLGLPAEASDLALRTNSFINVPNREGSVAWLKFYYEDGTPGFARLPEGDRPMLFNKDIYAEKGRS